MLVHARRILAKILMPYFRRPNMPLSLGEQEVGKLTQRLRGQAVWKSYATTEGLSLSNKLPVRLVPWGLSTNPTLWPAKGFNPSISDLACLLFLFQCLYSFIPMPDKAMCMCSQ